MWTLIHPMIYFIFKWYIFLVYFEGLTLLELAAHLEGKAAKLRCEDLGKVKIALAGTNTSFLLDILEGCFGQKDLHTSKTTISLEGMETEATIEDITSNIPEKTPPTFPASGGQATAELVFPLKLVPTVIAGITEPFLPVCGLETLSLYHCQFPSCTLEISQKAAACNHIWHDHLNVALACLYCSFEHNPKICWYSASTWEHHTSPHSKENLPIHPDDLAFSQQFACRSGDGATPSTSGFASNLPHATVIHRWAETAKLFLEERSDQSTFHCLLFKGSDSNPCKAQMPHQARSHETK